MAEVLLHEKVIKEDGDIIEVRILKVPADAAHPEGIRYFTKIEELLVMTTSNRKGIIGT